MLVICQGPGCGIEFEAKRPHAKYHNQTCRKRAQSGPDAKPRTPPVQPRRRPARAYLEAATRSELAKLGRGDTTAGRQALILAKRIDNSAGETLAAVAAAMTAHANAMERATREGPAADPVKGRADEVARRRERHRATS